MTDPVEPPESSQSSRPPSAADARPPDGNPDASATAPSAADVASRRDRLRALQLRARRTAHRKSRQVGRISRTSMRYAAFMCGAGCVALFSIVFAYIAEVALRWNTQLTSATPWLAFVMLRWGGAGVRCLPSGPAPPAGGCGSPLVSAGVTLPPAGTAQTVLVSFRQSMGRCC